MFEQKKIYFFEMLWRSNHPWNAACVCQIWIQSHSHTIWIVYVWRRCSILYAHWFTRLLYMFVLKGHGNRRYWDSGWWNQSAEPLQGTTPSSAQWLQQGMLLPVLSLQIDNYFYVVFEGFHGEDMYASEGLRLHHVFFLERVMVAWKGPTHAQRFNKFEVIVFRMSVWWWVDSPPHTHPEDDYRKVEYEWALFRATITLSRKTDTWCNRKPMLITIFMFVTSWLTTHQDKYLDAVESCPGGKLSGCTIA